MSALAESESLHTRTRAMVQAFKQGLPCPESFEALALDIARFQARHIAGYAGLYAARGVDPRSTTRTIEVPAVPTDAFKLARVFAFDDDQVTALFRTSGTTVGARGTHRFRDVGTYEAASLAFGRSVLELRAPAVALVIGPPPEEAFDSSLTHMWATFVRGFGLFDDSDPYFVRNGAIDLRRLKGRLRSLTGHVPALVLGTSFAFVHLLDELGGEALPLPRGSRVVHTGGFKGRSREISPSELRRTLAQAFAVDEPQIVREYGMTELSSQFWESDDPRDGVYVEPPWARVVPVDPQSLLPVSDGDVGIARIEDLANVDSAFAVVAPDMVRRAGRGFELLGRARGAAARGCSIAIDEILASDRP
jgi:hypothetical protein